jgi:Putative prokaryotic signal transducing protein
MTLIDHQKEQQRLATIYASMSDTELTELTQDQKSLTEDALRVLESEFLRRGLSFERQNLAEVIDKHDLKLLTLRQFRDLPEALVAKGVLDSAGIKSFLANENTMRMAWSNVVGSVKLWVREEDVSQAVELLGHDFSTESEIADSADNT